MPDSGLIGEINFGVNLVIQRSKGYTWSKLPEATLASKSGSAGDIAMLKLSILASKGISIDRLFLATSHQRKTCYAVVKSEFKAWLGGGRHPCLLVLYPDSNTVKERRAETIRGFWLTSYAEAILARNQ